MHVADCMNTLLYSSCSNPSETKGYEEFAIELHCNKYLVTAKVIGKTFRKGEHVFSNYEILKLEEDSAYYSQS